eukprot:g46843.t1
MKEELKEILISQEMVLRKLMGLQPDKSTGPDALHPGELKEVALEIVDALVIIFQHSVDFRKVPMERRSLQVGIQVQQAVRKSNGGLAFIAREFEYRRKDVLLQLYRTLNEGHLMETYKILMELDRRDSERMLPMLRKSRTRGHHLRIR